MEYLIKFTDTVIELTKQDTLPTISQNHLSSAYKALLESQSQTYIALISVFIGVVALFGVLNFIQNKYLFKKDIETLVNRIFQKEKEKFLDGQKENFQKELYHLKADSARLFAALIKSIITPIEDKEEIGLHVNHIYWWNEFLANIIMGQNPKGVRIGLEQLNEALKLIKDKNIEENFVAEFNEKYDYQYLYDTLNNVPELLEKERNQIFDLLNEIGLSLSKYNKESTSNGEVKK
jgi:hypothetical protein